MEKHGNNYKTKMEQNMEKKNGKANETSENSPRE